MTAKLDPRRKRGKTGRPTKKTPENRAAIIRGVKAGLFPETAAQVAGVGNTTLREWLDEDPDLRAEIAQARAQAEARKVAYIERQAPGSWKAAAWLLSKSNPQRFGDKLQVGGTGEPVTVRVVYVDDTRSDGDA